MSHPYHGLNELREMFLKFFETKGHLRLPSFSLVPYIPRGSTKSSAIITLRFTISPVTTSRNAIAPVT